MPVWSKGAEPPTFKTATVIASVEYNEDWWLLLLLNTAPPYYTVAMVSRFGTVGEEKNFYNIGPAVTEGYAQMGGDW